MHCSSGSCTHGLWLVRHCQTCCSAHACKPSGKHRWKIQAMHVLTLLLIMLQAR